jgi:amicyanin
MNKKMIVILIVLILIIFGGYLFLRFSGSPQKNQVRTPSAQNPATTASNTPEQMPPNQNMPTTSNENVTPPPASTPAPTPEPVSTPVPAESHNVSIINFSFNPSTLTINKGDTVVWTNNDSVPHQVKGDALNTLAGPVLSNGQTYSFTFNDTGTFSYHCAIHPFMTGTIIVK